MLKDFCLSSTESFCHGRSQYKYLKYTVWFYMIILRYSE